jgi:type II secretory pathway component PulF
MGRRLVPPALAGALKGSGMTIPYPLFGGLCLVVAVLLTLVFPIQRGRLSNQLWDFITLALFVLGAWWVNYWDALSNFGVGLIAGLVAVVIRDVRLWLVRFRGQAYRRSHRYYWYGRARDWYGSRRRRY